MIQSDLVDKIFPALVKAQSELAHAVKDSTNPHFKSRYADLTAVWEAAKPVLKANGLAALQDAVSVEGAVGVRTRLIHSSGQWVEFEPAMIPLDKKNAQGTGSALTYGRRYSLSAALGVVADEDDDGNAASNSPTRSGVADAQSNTEQKNAPGIMKARGWVKSHLDDLGRCDDPENFMAVVKDHTQYWVRMCSQYPGVWVGPDGSGLKGEGQRMATILQCRKEYDAFITDVEAAAHEVNQPQAAE